MDKGKLNEAEDFLALKNEDPIKNEIKHYNEVKNAVSKCDKFITSYKDQILVLKQRLKDVEKEKQDCEKELLTLKDNISQKMGALSEEKAQIERMTSEMKDSWEKFKREKIDPWLETSSK